jgi:periplasmic protein TonB
MNRVLFYQPDTGSRWSYRVIGLSLLVTLGFFMILPIAEMLHKQKNKMSLRSIDTLEIVKAPPPIPPKVKKKLEQPKPKLNEPRKKLSPLQIQAALQLNPGHADFSLVFNVQGDLQGESLVFEISEVDERPRPISQIAPLYPMKAKMRKIEGRVVFLFVVQTDGSVDQIKVVSSEPGDMFVAAATSALRKWKFKPGKRNGKAVSTMMTIPIPFKLQ